MNTFDRTVERAKSRDHGARKIASYLIEEGYDRDSVDSFPQYMWDMAATVTHVDRPTYLTKQLVAVLISRD